MVGYAKSQADMPKWGQLGCSGFIILDAQRRVVCPATAAFLKMRGLAFAHVEALLDALLAGEAVPAVCPAQCVVLDKVEDPKKRGMRGVALDATDPSSGKCNVFLLSGSGGGSMVRVSAAKLRVLPGDAIDISPRQLQAIEQARAVVLVARQKEPREPPATAPCDESAEHRKRNAEGESKGAAVDTPPLRQGVDGDEGYEGVDGYQAAEALGPVRVASVLNDELDRQHEECAAALEELARTRSGSALDVALRVIRRHFETEELLLDRHLYGTVTGAGGGASETFSIQESMRKSHFADHKRIILTMEEQLAALGSGHDGGKACSSSAA